MCALPSSHRERDVVHAQLTELLGEHGPLSVVPDAVRTLLSPELAAEVAEEYRALSPPAAADGSAVIVTAGPPGAGKSTVFGELGKGHRRIDPDQIKDLLLARLEGVGLLRARLGHVLADGRPVTPGELSGWVHRASTDIADVVRARSLQEGENVVIEGTLFWEPLVQVYTDELSAAGYERLTVVDVEVPVDAAIEQARGRWWDGRRNGAALGGRFMSDEAIRSFYGHGVTTLSRCASNARAMFELGVELEMESDLRILTRSGPAGRAMSATITADGAGPWATPGLDTAFGARCISCGRPITSPESVAEGFGPECRGKVAAYRRSHG